MALSAADLPPAADAGPNGSMPFGDATQMRQERRAVESAGSSPRNPGGPAVPQQSAGRPALPVPSAPMAPPVQPAPPLATNSRLAPPQFTQLSSDGVPGHQRIIAWAQHPEAGPYLRLLARVARGEVRSTGQARQQPAAQQQPPQQTMNASGPNPAGAS